MKCITICAPWAWACTVGPKRIENRPWPIKYRGTLLIHCGKSEEWFTPAALDTLRAYQVPGLFAMHYPGHIVGVVEVIASVSPKTVRAAMPDQVPFLSGPECHVYHRRRWFENPIPFRGAQGLFDVPDDLVAEAIRAARPSLHERTAP